MSLIWYYLPRHAIYSPSSKTLFKTKVFPGVEDYLYDIEVNNKDRWDDLKEQISLLVSLINSAKDFINGFGEYWNNEALFELFSYAVFWEKQKQLPDVFYKKSVLKKFPIFTGNYLCSSLFLIKLQTLRPATLLKRLQHKCFPVNIAKFLRTPILKNICDACF